MDILSFAIGMKVGAAKGGGSADERVKYVTFMYGGTELLKYPVIAGDTCHDPVSKGLIDTPTKEQTVSTVYTYSGWALTDGGAASSSALANVTEDRTVYAAFTEAARMYTINFYDGETLLKSEQVAYGGSSDYTYKKEGYLFTGWTPEPTNIAADMDCYGAWMESAAFADASWETIEQMATSGLASQAYNLGDRKDIQVYASKISKWITVPFEIVGFNHDDLADGSGKAGITLMSVPCFDLDELFGLTVNYVGGGKSAHWNANANVTTLKTYISKFEEEVRNRVKTVKKLTNGAYTDGNPLIESEERLWVPSATEMGGGTYQTAGQGTKYSYFDTAAKMIKYPYKASGIAATAVDWFLRSHSTHSSSMPSFVSETGSVIGYPGPEDYNNTAFCICI